MTRTLELPEELESALTAKAVRLGVPVELYAIEVLRHDLENKDTPAQNEHRQRVRALLGKYKGMGFTVDDFLRERREEVAHDEARVVAHKR